jgi:hypothetical protein
VSFSLGVELEITLLSPKSSFVSVCRHPLSLRSGIPWAKGVVFQLRNGMNKNKDATCPQFATRSATGHLSLRLPSDSMNIPII